MITKEYNYENCKVIIHYPEKQERIRNATIDFLKEVEKQKVVKK